MKKAKMIAIGVLVLLVAIVVLQNFEKIETKFLFVSVEMPLAILILVNTLIGAALGVLATLLLLSRRK